MNRLAAPEPLILPSNLPPMEACAPRADFTPLAQALGNASLLFPPTSAAPIVRPLERRTASDLRQVIAAFRHHRHVSVFVSLSEKIGLPLALLLKARRKGTPHVLVAHHLTSARKRALQERYHWLNALTKIVVLSEPQAEYLRQEADYPKERVAFLPDSVDTAFWQARGTAVVSDPPFVLSVGQERRDYATLFATAQNCPEIRFVVVAGSVWSDRNTVLGNPPPNVSVRHGLSYADLRDLYKRAAFVVVPLVAETLYAAGANGLLEAMAVGKAVVLAGTPGLRGYVTPKEACIVPAGDSVALSAAIRCLGESPRDAARLGVAAQCRAETAHSLEVYTSVLAGIVREAESEAAG